MKRKPRMQESPFMATESKNPKERTTRRTHRLDLISEVFPNLDDAVNFMGLAWKSPVWGAGSLQAVEFSQKQQLWSWEEKPLGSLLGSGTTRAPKEASSRAQRAELAPERAGKCQVLLTAVARL